MFPYCLLVDGWKSNPNRGVPTTDQQLACWPFVQYLDGISSNFFVFVVITVVVHKGLAGWFGGILSVDGWTM